MTVQSDVQNNVFTSIMWMHNMALEIVYLNHSYLISSNYIFQSESIECGMPTENPPFK